MKLYFQTSKIKYEWFKTMRTFWCVSPSDSKRHIDKRDGNVIRNSWTTFINNSRHNSDKRLVVSSMRTDKKKKHNTKMNFIREPEQETLKYLLNMSVTLGCRSTNLTTCWWHWTTTSRLTATTFKSFSGILQILEQKAKDRILHNGRKTYTHTEITLQISLSFCPFSVLCVSCVCSKVLSFSFSSFIHADQAHAPTCCIRRVTFLLGKHLPCKVLPQLQWGHGVKSV